MVSGVTLWATARAQQVRTVNHVCPRTGPARRDATLGSVMNETVDTAALHHAVEQLAHAVQNLENQAGNVVAVRRLRNDLERLRIDSEDCRHLHGVQQVRELEVIPDTPYDQSMWQGVDDEGLGGFRQQATRHRESGRRR